MAPSVRNLTDVLLDPTEDEPTVQQIAELFLRDSTTTFTNKTLAHISNYIHADATHYKVRALENINIGQPVKFTSYNLGTDSVEVNLADNALGISIGLAASTVTTGEDFLIITNGILKGFDTTGYTTGDILYVNGTGILTPIEPTTGVAQPIAFVIKSAGGLNGSLRINASYPKQDADDVRYDTTGMTVKEAIDGIVASGSNANGSWIKFSDGTLICFSETTADVETNGVNKAQMSSQTYPVAFVGITPAITITNIRKSTSIMHSGIWSTYIDSSLLVSFRPSMVATKEHSTTSAGEMTISWQAIGRWK